MSELSLPGFLVYWILSQVLCYYLQWVQIFFHKCSQNVTNFLKKSCGINYMQHQNLKLLSLTLFCLGGCPAVLNKIEFLHSFDVVSNSYRLSYVLPTFQVGSCTRRFSNFVMQCSVLHILYCFEFSCFYNSSQKVNIKNGTFPGNNFFIV